VLASDSPATQASDATAGVRGPQEAAAESGRRHRRRDPWRTAFFVGMVVALAIGVGWALLGSSFFVVRSIKVIGTARVPSSEIIAAAGLKLGTPLVRIDTGAIARRVERVTQVQSAKVRRSWPDEVIITTVGRTAVFAVRSGRGYDVIDRYGVILGHAARVRAGVFLLKKATNSVGTLRGNAAVYAAGTIVAGLPRWLKHRLVAVRASTKARVVLLLRHDITVVWGGTGRVSQKAAELAVLLRTRATYFDVSDPQLAMTGWPG
jgi:cell division protein FtsQ